jgi:non-heme chloroperoxidase
MSFVQVRRQSAGPVLLSLEDHGRGDPVVLVHGSPLSGGAWEKQQAALLSFGHRVITYDRRGFGASSRTSDGYDYDTFAADLDAILRHLDVRDATLVGASTGTGDVVRYLGIHGSDRVARAVLLAPLPPFLLRTKDNPDGVEPAIFDELRALVVDDRFAAIKVFLDAYYNMDTLASGRASDQVWQSSFNVAAAASAMATLAAVQACKEDFREDVRQIDIPVLVIQGDADRIFPPEATGNRLADLLDRCRHEVIRGGPHALAWTHATEVNRALLEFITGFDR